MKNTEEIRNFVLNFVENYDEEIVEDDVVGFYNDTLMMLRQFSSLNDDTEELKRVYHDFISHVLRYSDVLKEYVSFDFKSVSTLEQLRSDSAFKELQPLYTSYSFQEAEETIDQIFEEIKSVKEFHKELKEEIGYLLEEYQFHLEHMEENRNYDFYVYDVLDGIPEQDIHNTIEDIQLEKRKFIQKCNDKLAKK